MPDIRFVVYVPPQDGYPFLAVALSPTEVSAVALIRCKKRRPTMPPGPPRPREAGAKETDEI
jgi:hypothetical protein